VSNLGNVEDAMNPREASLVRLALNYLAANLESFKALTTMLQCPEITEEEIERLKQKLGVM
jgi:hypothetical protein